MLVSIAILALIVAFVTQLVNSAATISTLCHKRMDADSQARQLFDRMEVDFAKMLKRSDVSYWVKTLATTEPGNDQIAFFSAVPSNNSQVTAAQNSQISLVAYRVNNDPTSASYNKLERMAKGLALNGASTSSLPLLFLPITISGVSSWAAATNTTATDTDYQLIGPQVFRFEYHYLLTTDATSRFVLTKQFSIGPWADVPSFSIKDVAAMVVDIAVIDPRSKAPLTNAQIGTLVTRLDDFSDGMG